MARFLNPKLIKWILFAPAVLLAISVFFDAGVIYAGRYSSTFTGYAHGNANGKSGHYVDQGSFANHKMNGNPACSGAGKDPASLWNWGSVINTTQSITLHSYSGSPYSQSTFTLWDSGDINCVEPYYWVDIYFGRYNLQGNPCNCPGSPSPGYCVNAYYNSCLDARSFGAPTRSYDGP